MTRRTALATLVLAGLIALSGCVAADSLENEANATLTNETDPAEEIAYTIDYNCKDHMSAGGEYINECSVDVHVTESLPDGVAYVELHVSDAIDAETESYLITDVDTRKYAYATDHTYGDVVIVEAQLSNGERVVLENYTLSCADVSYRDACSEESDSE